MSPLFAFRLCRHMFVDYAATPELLPPLFTLLTHMMLFSLPLWLLRCFFMFTIRCCRFFIWLLTLIAHAAIFVSPLPLLLRLLPRYY